MTASISPRTGAFAALLTAAVLALALAFSAPAGARTRGARGAACAHSTVGRAEHGAHTCADSGGTGRSHGKGGRSRTHRKSSGHHPEHPTKQPAGEGGESVEEAGEEAGESGEPGAGAELGAAEPGAVEASDES